jgi:hypothetical protein
MKKILFIVLLSPFAFHLSPCQAQGAWDLKRFNLEVEYHNRPTELELGTGLFASHPERTLHTGINYRLLQHWEVGFYLGFQGCHLDDYSHQDIGDAAVGSIYYKNGFFVNYGFQVQLHLMPFNKRNYAWADVFLRLGVGKGYEENGLWGGFGVAWNATNHLSFQLNIDFGGWYNGKEILDAHFTETAVASMRTGIGIKLEL